MKLIAYYTLYNEADFIQYSLASIYDYVDSIIIIEGAWAENYVINGHERSTDGTIEIIQGFPDPLNKIRMWHHNGPSQLAQRSRVFKYITDERCMLWLIDGDEVYERDQAEAVQSLVKNFDDEEEKPYVYTIDSLTFINDFYTYTPIRFPRLFYIEPHSLSDKFEFVEPNHIARNGKRLNDHTIDTDIRFFHYSYCHSPERFMEKKRERTKLHGNFSWEMSGGIVYKNGVKLHEFNGEHPEAMSKHPAINTRILRKRPQKELIVYVEHSGIGNMVLTTPTLKALRKAKPDAQIEVVGWKRSNRIIEGLECVDLIHDIGNQGFATHFRNKQIDHLLLAPCGAHDGVVKFLSALSKDIHRVRIPDGIWQQHEYEYKMSLARKLGYRGPNPELEVPIFEYNNKIALATLNNALRLPGSKMLPQFIALNTGYLKNDHWPMKHWGNEKYSELLIRLHNAWPGKYLILLFGAVDDYNDAEEIIERSENDLAMNMCGAFPDIKDTAVLLAHAVLSIGNDSGLQHIAAAVNTPTITMFTFTNPIKNKPIGKKASVVMNPCKYRLICQHGQWQSCGDKGCLDISVDSVWKEVMKGIDKWRT